MNVWTRATWNKVAAASFAVAIGLTAALPAFAAEHEPTPTPDPTAVPGDATPTDDEPSGTVLGASPTNDEGPRGDKPIPPGQLVRRGIFGTVVGYVDDGVIIETKFGEVTVLVDDATSYADGARFSALLDRSPVPPDASGTPDDGSFRTVTALRVTGVPNKASRSHLRSVVVGSSSGTDDEGTLTILDDDGNPIVLENGGASGTLDGEDTILLIRGRGVGPPVVIDGITSSSVHQRLARLLETAPPERLAKFEELILARQARLDARLQRLEENAPDALKAKVRGAHDKSKGRGASGGGDGEDGGPSDGKGKPDDKGKPDGGGGNSGGGGGNSGGGGGKGKVK